MNLDLLLASAADALPILGQSLTVTSDDGMPRPDALRPSAPLGNLAARSRRPRTAALGSHRSARRTGRPPPRRPRASPRLTARRAGRPAHLHRTSPQTSTPRPPPAGRRPPAIRSASPSALVTCSSSVTSIRSPSTSSKPSPPTPSPAASPSRARPTTRHTPPRCSTTSAARWPIPPNVLLFSVGDGTGATDQGRANLVQPVAAECRTQQALGEGRMAQATIDNPVLAGRDAADDLLRRAAAPEPTVLFTMSHGLAAPSTGWSERERRALQGALSLGGRSGSRLRTSPGGPSSRAASGSSSRASGPPRRRGACSTTGCKSSGCLQVRCWPISRSRARGRSSPRSRRRRWRTLRGRSPSSGTPTWRGRTGSAIPGREALAMRRGFRPSFARWWMGTGPASRGTSWCASSRRRASS